MFLEYHDCENIFGDTPDAILKAIAKHRNHPSMKAFKKISSSDDLFSLDIVDREEIQRKLVV